MKKMILALTLSSLFSINAAQAEDHSSIINIDGVVSAPVEGNCSVLPEKYSVSLSGNSDTLPVQGNNATDATTFSFQVGGDLECIDKINAGHVSVRLKGTLDDADCNVLSISDIVNTAAIGVGIGVFNTDKTPVNLKDNHTLITGTPLSFGLQMVQLEQQTVMAGTVHGALTIEIERL